MIGVGKSIWKVGPLLSGGPSAPAGEEIISAQVTYGALGTCQTAALRTAKPLNLPNRMRLWTLSMAGQGNLFTGIVDQPTGNPGELGQVTLLAPHRQYLDGLGYNIGYPYPLRSFGVPVVTKVEDWEKTSDVLGKVLDPYPTADYGVGADLEGGIGLPDYATPIILDASQALSVSSQGYSIPNYTTDAIFDPGEGWPKYTYRRDVPGYAPRITGQATADPAIIIKQDSVSVFRDASDVSPTVANGVTHKYQNVIITDGEAKKYAEDDSTATELLSDIGVYTFTTPADVPDRRNQKVTVRCPFLVTSLGAWPIIRKRAPSFVTGYTSIGLDGSVTQHYDDISTTNLDGNASSSDIIEAINRLNSGYSQTNKNLSNAVASSSNLNANAQQTVAVVNTLVQKVNDLDRDIVYLSNSRMTSRGVPKNGEIKLNASIYLNDDVKPLASQSHVLKENDVGLALSFEFVVSDIGKGANLRVRYDMVEQDTGKYVEIAFNPITAVIDYETPNLDAVQMPQGWDAPASVGPIYELKFAGWHIPPIRITGLPGGVAQMAAGSTVTHNRQEASTTVTTMAWPYAGQRRA